MNTLTCFALFLAALALCLTALATPLNAEMACAILAAAGVLTIAVTDYGTRRPFRSGLTA